MARKLLFIAYTINVKCTEIYTAAIVFTLPQVPKLGLATPFYLQMGSRENISSFVWIVCVCIIEYYWILRISLYESPSISTSPSVTSAGSVSVLSGTTKVKMTDAKIGLNIFFNMRLEVTEISECPSGVVCPEVWKLFPFSMSFLQETRVAELWPVFSPLYVLATPFFLYF